MEADRVEVGGEVELILTSGDESGSPGGVRHHMHQPGGGVGRVEGNLYPNGSIFIQNVRGDTSSSFAFQVPVCAKKLESAVSRI